MLFHKLRWRRPVLPVFVLRTPAGKTFILSLCCWLLAFAYSKNRFWRNPHSAYFNSDYAYERQYSSFRASQADAFIAAASNNNSLSKASASPEICAAIVTVQRNPSYVDHAIASMLEGLRDEERSRLFVQILFADTVPSVHSSWNATWIQNAVDLAATYEGVSSEILESLREMQEQHDFGAKGVFDYVYVLEKCYESQTPYIAVFEDDVIFADGWLIKTLKALEETKLHAGKGEKFWNWVYLRLFYTETFFSWNADDDFWYANRYRAAILAAFGGAVTMFGIRILVPTTKKMLNNYTIIVFCAITIPAFIALLFMMGKAILFGSQYRGVFTLNKNGCCTQGLVFPREQVPEFAQYLREKKRGQTDAFLEDYATERGKQRIAIGPQVIQHVGLVSSRGMGQVQAQSVWAFFFEASDPEKLRKEHESLLQNLL